MLNYAIIDANKEMSKAKLTLLAMPTGEKIGYLVYGDFISSED